MARSSKNNRRDTRDTLGSLTDTLRFPSAVREVVPLNLIDLEDRRSFTPEIARPAKAVTYRSATQLKVPNVKTRSNRSNVPASVGFARPKEVVICVRRHTRREVLHAFRKTGRGGRKKIGKWSEFSHVRC